MAKKCLAEFLGTCWLVFGGCGSAVFAAFIAVPGGENVNAFGLGYLGVALAFGLTVLTGAYALGHISGGHFNPAVSFGLWAAKRFPGSQLLPYIIAQVLGAVLGAGLVYLIASGQAGFELLGANPLATNGYGAHSPQGFNLLSCLITEFLLTFVFLIIILGSTSERPAKQVGKRLLVQYAPAGFSPVAIGLALTLIHLISIPITNTSVNPARSLGPALFVGPELLGQVWLFWVAPILGAILGGLIYDNLLDTSTLLDQEES